LLVCLLYCCGGGGCCCCTEYVRKCKHLIHTNNERMIRHVGEDLALLVGVLDVAVLEDGALAHDLHGTDFSGLAMLDLPYLRAITKCVVLINVSCITAMCNT
jgi:hypothetical protein